MKPTVPASKPATFVQPPVTPLSDAGLHAFLFTPSGLLPTHESFPQSEFRVAFSLADSVGGGIVVGGGGGGAPNAGFEISKHLSVMVVPLPSSTFCISRQASAVFTRGELTVLPLVGSLYLKYHPGALGMGATDAEGGGGIGAAA